MAISQSPPDSREQEKEEIETIKEVDTIDANRTNSELSAQRTADSRSERQKAKDARKAANLQAHADAQAAKEATYEPLLPEREVAHVLGFSWSDSKRWRILTVIFIVQISMNFNASVYANAVSGMEKHFNISAQLIRVGQMVFLVAYAFGCELWAPWSEEIGRKPILQASLFFVNIWQIPCALAQNYTTVVIARGLGGLSSAGGSVTLGIVADMWQPEEQQYAVAYVVLSSVGGSVVGPIVGAFIEQYLSWRWIFWVQLIFGAVTQVLHYFLVPETRVAVLHDREAKRQRNEGKHHLYGPEERKGTFRQRMDWRQICTIWWRPFHMLLTEPIVLCLSLLSGFSDALIFTFLESYGLVFRQWNFSTIALGMAFIPLIIGYVIAYFSFFPFFAKDRKKMRRDGPDSLVPERRLYWLLWTAPLLPIGLLGFAWTSLGPQHVHWIGPLIFSALVGIANYAVYMATIDYMVAAYGQYSASATGGNGFARDFLAGVSAMYAVPFYEHKAFDRYALEWPTTILALIAALFILPIYVFYNYGQWFRTRSTFAEALASTAEDNGGRRASTLPSNVPAAPASSVGGAVPKERYQRDVRENGRAVAEA